ncbi:MAG: hypothetical protein HY791_06870 [Deltaproteobacteria bacterium]|nr:hypothetical protein [Deltaproteobacteria bacterium]
MSALLAASCDASETYRAADLPESIRYAVLVSESVDGAFLAASPLVSMESDGSFRFELEDTSAENLRFVGFTAERMSTEVGRPIGPEALEPARLDQLALPDPDFVALASPDRVDLEVQPNGSAPSLSATWLGSCTSNPCELNPLRAGHLLPVPDGGAPFVAAIRYSREAQAALVANTSGEYFRVTSSSATKLLENVPKAVPSSLFLDSKGEIWVLTSTGILMSGHPDRGFVVRGTMQVPSGGAISGGDRDGLPELFVATNAGQLYRHFRGELELVYEMGTRHQGQSSVAWTGPGAATAAFDLASLLVEYDAGASPAVRDENFPRQPDLLAMVPGIGLILATGRELGKAIEFYRRESGKWVLIENAPGLPSSAEIIYPLGPGVLIGGVRSALAFYHPDLGSCESQVYSDFNMKSIVEMDGGVLTIGGQSEARAMFFTLEEGLKRSCRARVP